MISEEIKKIDEKINASGILEAISLESENWISIVLTICQMHGFSEEDTLSITREVGYILLDVAQPEDFLDEIQKHTRLTTSSIKILIQDLTEKLFKRIAENYSLLEEVTSIELQRFETEDLIDETNKNHILIVPIKPKEGQLAEEKEVAIPDTSTYIDPYKEIPE